MREPKFAISSLSPWTLYWVQSGGIEDCFVVAKNSRSACSVEINMNGFDTEDVKATGIARIPEDVANSYRRGRHQSCPWYVYGKSFFKKMGAEFRTIGGKEEMLLHDVVYSVDEYAPCLMSRERVVGEKAISELHLDSELGRYEFHDEDRWTYPTIHLITILGWCLLTCQQIEFYIAHSFLLGISKKQKQQYRTLNDLRDGWKRKTLGNMLNCIEEAWLIEPTLKANLQLFVANRNRLIHGITTDERFDIRTAWGQKELLAFLSFFDVHARIVKAAFRASYYASIDFALRQWGRPKGVPKRILGHKERKEIELFVALFEPKDGAI